MTSADDSVILSDAIRGLLPGSVAVACARPSGMRDTVFGVEDEIVARAIARRQCEFFTGRRLARAALAELGQPPVAITRGDRGMPLWPDGVVGSITHCRAHCAAIAALATRFEGLGIDIEDDAPLESGLVRMICVGDELAHRGDVESVVGIDLPKLIFSIKEAAYKCVFPSLRCFIDFREAKVSLEPERGAFEVCWSLSHPALPDGSRAVRGAFASTEGHVVAAAMLPAC